MIYACNFKAAQAIVLQLWVYMTLHLHTTCYMYIHVHNTYQHTYSKTSQTLVSPEHFLTTRQKPPQPQKAKNPRKKQKKQKKNKDPDTLGHLPPFALAELFFLIN